MNKRKNIIIIISLVIITTTIIIANTKKGQRNNLDENIKAPEKKVTFEVKDISSRNDDEIIVNIKMVNDSNFVAANFELSYNSDQIEYINYEEGEILKKSAISIVNNDQERSKVFIAYVANPQNKTNIIEAGNMINITFKLKKNIGDKEIFPEFKVTTLKNKEGQDVEYIVNQGTTVVSK